MTSVNLLKGSRLLQEMFAKNTRYAWGNIANLSEGAVQELGIEGAMAEAAGSPRRASSGMTEEMKRRPRKERQAYYTRKAIHEAEKEAERRRRWQRRHPGASESNWRRREATRKTRKAAERAWRKGIKRSSSRKS
jgi:hypothetical protein